MVRSVVRPAAVFVAAAALLLTTTCGSTGPTSYPTYTPYPTYTSVGMPAPTLTPYPTYTALPGYTPFQSSAPRPTPPPSSTQQFDQLPFQIVSVTSPVRPGANATLVAQTTPGAECDITVYYQSGASKARGLYPKAADSSGTVSWTWMVGTRTTPGTWLIVVKANYGGKTVTQTTEFAVSK